MRPLTSGRLETLIDSLVLGSRIGAALAADTLEQHDDSRAVSRLLERVRHAGGPERRAAARALERVEIHAGVDSLAAALADTSAYVRWAAATSLAARTSDRAAPALREALDDPDTGVRQAAARALGALADSASFVALIEHRADSAEEVRAEIARAMVGAGESAVELLRNYVETDSGLVVSVAIDALGRCGGTSDVPLVGVSLLDGTVPIRAASARALGFLGGEQAGTLLLAATRDDPSPLVREAAVLGLGTGRPDLVPDLVAEQFEAEFDPFVRRAWVDALRRTSPGGRRVLEMLADHDFNPDVRAAAARALQPR